MTLRDHAARPLLLATALAAFALSGCDTGDAATENKDERTVGGKGDSPDEWCHLNLFANDDVEISYDYQVKDTSDEDSFDLSATPGWINVRRGDFGPHLDAAAVLVVREWDTECGNECRDNFSREVETHVVELEFEHGRFTGEIPALKIRHHDNNSNGGGTDGLFELAVVVDGDWYKGFDGRNLRLIPQDSLGNCGQGSTFLSCAGSGD